MSLVDNFRAYTDEILARYERALRDADSPLTTTADRWHQARSQAEEILGECLHLLDPIAQERPDPQAVTRELGIERANQQILVADSIRAGILLWRAAVPVLREVATSEDAALLPDMLDRLHEAISIRLYIGSVAHEHVRLANRAAVAKDEQHSEPEAVTCPDNITKREWEVLKCVGRAFSNREIAKELAISEPTVKAHLRKIFRKLTATSRVDAINKVGLPHHYGSEG
ncbi:helix-turn-helix transcriptional regulator [Micromonospora sp. NPDC002296]|uniref:helix-turn-helix transcriptional regulator n=1 Tax=Micromonospora sp. NPDC002296 TaxID=3154271 RepID=UPI00332D8956